MSFPFFKMHGLGNDFVVVDCRASALVDEEIRQVLLADESAASASDCLASRCVLQLRGVVLHLGDRKRGVGCDQVVLLSDLEKNCSAFGEVASVRMRIYNGPDGFRVGACGNATRCVAALIALHCCDGGAGSSRGIVDVAIVSDAGVLRCKTDCATLLPPRVSDNLPTSWTCMVSVNMGAPRLSYSLIPLALPLEVDECAFPVHAVPHELLRLDMADLERLRRVCGGESCPPTFCAVSMGNPHAVFFTDALASGGCDASGGDDFASYTKDFCDAAASVQRSPLFPQGVNVSLARVVTAERRCDEQSRQLIQVRVFERGVGLTEACGTAACACVVAAVLTCRLDVGDSDEVEVQLDGGSLFIRWVRGDSSFNGEPIGVVMRGPATMAFRGTAAVPPL